MKSTHQKELKFKALTFLYNNINFLYNNINRKEKVIIFKLRSSHNKIMHTCTKRLVYEGRNWIFIFQILINFTRSYKKKILKFLNYLKKYNHFRFYLITFIFILFHIIFIFTLCLSIISNKLFYTFYIFHISHHFILLRSAFKYI